MVFYNEGCARARFGSGWEAQAAYEFKEWMAHEVGHAVLRAAPPDSAPVVKYGAFPLTRGQSWSWTHKGSSSIYQARARGALHRRVPLRQPFLAAMCGCGSVLKAPQVRTCLCADRPADHARLPCHWRD